MASAPQHSDLLFDFGPRGFADEAARVDWVPAETPTYDSQAMLDIPVVNFSSQGPLPLVPATPLATTVEQPALASGEFGSMATLCCVLVPIAKLP
jgi:hypothetical protein